FLGVVLSRVLSERSTRLLVVLVIGVSALAAGWAFLAWVGFHKTVMVHGHPQEVGITRGGGPFGNYYANRSSDHWWVGQAATNNLGLWIAVALGPALALGFSEWFARRRVWILALGAAAIVTLVLGLAATYSRES